MFRLAYHYPWNQRLWKKEFKTKEEMEQYMATKENMVVWEIAEITDPVPKVKKEKVSKVSKVEEVKEVIEVEEVEEVSKVSKVIGYCRVSSKKQLEGNGLQAQEKEIISRYPGAKIEVEQYTGTKTDRPVFNEVIKQLKKGDTLVVSKLDRLARNTVEGIQIVEELFKKGVAVHVLNVGLLEDTTMGRFFLTTMLAVAEMERNTIIERTQSGKEIAKTKEGYKEGRPKAHGDKIEQALSMLSINGGDMSYTQVERLTGISKSTLIRRMREKKSSS